ncbi:MAG: cupin domain-containing protein [Chloroflexi bacterium]|nr:cupin domain-containing protein [Chloroflexota bacterium]
MAVIRNEEAEWFELEPGIDVKVLSHETVGATALHSGMATFGPGAGLACHTHDCEESVTILAGEAFLDVDGRRMRLTPFDTSIVQADVPHRYSNASSESPMKMFWVYASPDAARTIVDAELCAIGGD